jgi:hypothetical protein
MLMVAGLTPPFMKMPALLLLSSHVLLAEKGKKARKMDGPPFLKKKLQSDSQ